jgi:hypothetical protein
MSTQTNQPQAPVSEPAESTHLVLVLDRSGSMASLRDDVIGGWNEFLSGQQAEPGKATLTHIQFDSQDPFEVVHHFKALSEVPPLDHRTFVPRGGTPLLDALGKAIVSTSMDLASAAPGTRPGKILFVCITDGQENASRQYTKPQVTEMVERMQGGGWQFVFLSSDMSAVSDATRWGFNPDNVMQFQHSGAGIRRSMTAMNEKARMYRKDTYNINSSIAFSMRERYEAMNPEENAPDGQGGADHEGQQDKAQP